MAGFATEPAALEDITMGDSPVMTYGRHAKDEELTVSEVEVETLPQATEPTTDPAEGGSSGSDDEENGDDIRWQGGPDEPGGGSGSGGSGS